MTSKAIDLLDAKRNGPGFFLQVEGASIDKQDHAANACGQIGETVDLDEAVKVALEDPAVRQKLVDAGKTFEQDVAEAGRLRASRTASRDVSHKPSLSVLASRPMPMKHRGLRVDEAVSAERVRRTVRRAGPVARG